MKTLCTKKFQELGYECGSATSRRFTSWLQYADDAVIVSSSVKGSQALLNLFVAWCHWSGMVLRLDKCCTFGMTKTENVFKQTLPGLFVDGSQVPPVRIDDDFTYLGKLFHFDINSNTAAKDAMMKKLRELLTTTGKLKVRPQKKLKILKLFIHAQLIFEFKIYDLPLTWVENSLDAMCTSYVRDWMETPISSCVGEIQRLPVNRTGLGIPSFKDVAEKISLKKRQAMKKGQNLIWKETTTKHVVIDELINTSTSLKAATLCLSKRHTQEAWSHVQALTIQGKSATSIVENITKQNITLWSTTLSSRPAAIYNFAHKALLSQLPTNSNLARWKRTQNANCSLCGNTDAQTNKHVLSNCASSIALNRYRVRHDTTLLLLARWLHSVIGSGQSLYADLETGAFSHLPIRDLFKSLRPDLAIVDTASIHTWELTVCHETNLASSRLYKQNKYHLLRDDTTSLADNKTIHNHTIEVSVLGLVSDTLNFTSAINLPVVPPSLLRALACQALDSSFKIYCARNSSEPIQSFTM
jgi:hypothetical protein